VLICLKKFGQLQIEVDWIKKDLLPGLILSEEVKSISLNDEKPYYF